MVKCTSCGKTIDKIPDWMNVVSVEYVCNNCPNRHTKNIAFINLEPDLPAKAPDEEEAEVEEAAEAAEVADAPEEEAKPA